MVTNLGALLSQREDFGGVARHKPVAIEIKGIPIESMRFHQIRAFFASLRIANKGTGDSKAKTIADPPPSAKDDD